MYIDITGLDKGELLTHLIWEALHCLMEKNPERRGEYETLLSTVCHKGSKLSLVTGYLPFLPRDKAPWIDLSGDQFDTHQYNKMFGQDAARNAISMARIMQEERKEGSQGGASSAATAEEPSTSSGPGTSGAGSSGGGGEGPSTSLQGAGCSHGPHTGHQR